MQDPIYVTKPMLPELDSLHSKLVEIYDRAILTNMGPVHSELEHALHRRLGGAAFLLYNNGTIALLGALAALQLPAGAEVITTPFTFSATTHAIVMMGLKPVFADVEPSSMTLDVADVARKVTPRTAAIVGVHVYGFPCDVEGLAAIAARHDLRVLYDAAHAFDVRLEGRRLSDYGDASVYSFHATKLYNTVEGGGIAFTDPGREQAAKDFRNFGIRSEDRVVSVGSNGKMSELHAAVGLLNLGQVDEEIAQRRIVTDLYCEMLAGAPGVAIPSPRAGSTHSYQYFPIRLSTGRDHVCASLRADNIFARKYFYPLVTDYECYRDLYSSDDHPNAVRAAQEVLCLPLYGSLGVQGARRVARAVIAATQSAPVERESVVATR